MGIATEMKRLSEDIIASYDMRVKAVGELVKDTHETLSGFAGDRKRMAAQQAKDLADFTNGLSKNVQNSLKEFHRTHKQMSAEQSKSLSDFMKNLTSDVGSMLSGFEKDRSKMSKELNATLTKEVKEIETFVARKLKEFDAAHADMSEELRKDLAKYVAGIVKETGQLMREYGSDMAQAKQAWSGMSGTLAKARKGGVMPRIEAGEDVSTVRQAVKKGRGKKGSTSAKKRVPAGV